jgi:hypothetical protein
MVEFLMSRLVDDPAFLSRAVVVSSGRFCRAAAPGHAVVAVGY